MLISISRIYGRSLFSLLLNGESISSRFSVIALFCDVWSSSNVNSTMLTSILLFSACYSGIDSAGGDIIISFSLYKSCLFIKSETSDDLASSIASPILDELLPGCCLEVEELRAFCSFSLISLAFLLTLAIISAAYLLSYSISTRFLVPTLVGFSDCAATTHFSSSYFFFWTECGEASSFCSILFIKPFSSRSWNFKASSRIATTS